MQPSGFGQRVVLWAMLYVESKHYFCTLPAGYSYNNEKTSTTATIIHQNSSDFGILS